MRPEPKDMAYLWDMLDAARAIMQFIQGRSLEDLLADRMLRSAVERNLEIIGEAARRVSEKTRDGIPDIPWKKPVSPSTHLPGSSIACFAEIPASALSDIAA